MKIKELKETVRFSNLRVRTSTGEEGWYTSKENISEGKVKVILIPKLGSNKTVEIEFASAEVLLNEIFNWEILDFMTKEDICEICNDHISLGIVTSKLAAISYKICSECMIQKAEPDYVVLTTIEMVGWDIKKVAEWARKALIFYDKNTKKYVDATKMDIEYLKTYLLCHKKNEI